MRPILNSFYAKISALFLVLIVALGSTIAVLTVRSVMMFADEAEQKLNRDLAADLAVEFQPLLHYGIDPDSIEQKIEYVTGINPRIDIYLLGSNGMIKASFVEDGQELSGATVDTQRLDRFLAGAELPILGPDPLHEGAHKPFSGRDGVLPLRDPRQRAVRLGGQHDQEQLHRAGVAERAGPDGTRGGRHRALLLRAADAAPPGHERGRWGVCGGTARPPHRDEVVGRDRPVGRLVQSDGRYHRSQRRRARWRPCRATWRPL